MLLPPLLLLFPSPAWELAGSVFTLGLDCGSLAHRLSEFGSGFATSPFRGSYRLTVCAVMLRDKAVSLRIVVVIRKIADSGSDSFSYDECEQL